MRLITASFLFICLTSIGCFAAIPVTCWDAASEFNDSINPDAANPSGVWSYGWKEALTGKFVLAKTSVGQPSRTSGWASASGYPCISHSLRGIPVTANVNLITLPPYVLMLHPGPNGEYAIVRFTATDDGTYKISGQFYALDDNGSGTITDVWIVPNESKSGAFSAKVDYRGGSPWASFTSKVFELKKGGTLDFQVGYGANKNYEYDTTGLMALIEKIK